MEGVHQNIQGQMQRDRLEQARAQEDESDEADESHGTVQTGSAVSKSQEHGLDDD